MSFSGSRPSAVRVLLGALLAAAGVSACATGTTTRQQAGPAFDAVWRPHHATLNYFGLTALYSCDSLEDKVRELLLYLGARRDLTVQQAGCNRPFNAPGHVAAVTADFYTLTPVGEGTDPSARSHSADGAHTVAAQWSPVTIRPRVPIWMSDGECELLQQLKPVVTQNYSTRDLHYHTACVPHDAGISDYELSGEFVKPAPRR